MANLATNDNLAIDDLDRVLVLLGLLPAREILAVKQAVPAVLIGLRRVAFGSCGGRRGVEAKNQQSQ